MTYGMPLPAPASKAPTRRNLSAVGVLVVVGMAALALTTHVQSNELVFDDVEKDVEMDALSEEDPKGGYGEGEDVEMDEVEKVSKKTRRKKNQDDFASRTSDFEDKMPVWSGLGYVQKKAARALGWRKGTWDNYFLFQRDNNKKLYKKVAKYAQTWDSLSRADRSAAKRLGFTGEIWTHHDLFRRNAKKIDQESFAKRNATFEDDMPVWSKLTKRQVNDAKSLGWVKGTWDNYFLFQEDYNRESTRADAKYARSWSQLSASDHKNAKKLGFDRKSWAHHELFN